MKQSTEDPLRPHSFDGIQEYDKRLPNWWLATFYGAIAFSIGYWGYYQTFQAGLPPGTALEQQMKANAALAARNTTEVTDEILWKLSTDPAVVKAGEATYQASCVACHLPDLTGKIGPNLVDHDWIHGGKPLELVKVITEGVPLKGMLTWGPILGKQKITEVTAFILSYHKEGEPIQIVPSPPPGQLPVPAAQ